MIKAEGLTRHYGRVKALDGASFEVHPGEVVGLLGPNGAGKSTAMKILTTYLYPTAGKATVGGFDVVDSPLEVRRLTGYLPEMLPLYMEMEVRDYLRFVGRSRGLSGKVLTSRIDWVVSRCGLQRMYRKVIRELSKGYKQRTGLAQALIHDPAVIILDEPTSGLDPNQILGIRDLIRDLSREKTVILSTHILQEVEAVADRIVIINQGKIVGNGTVPELRKQTCNKAIIEVAVQAERDSVQKALKTISLANKVHFLEDRDGASCFEVTADVGTPVAAAIGELAHSKGWTLTCLAEKPFSLEGVFLALTRKNASTAQGGAA